MALVGIKDAADFWMRKKSDSKVVLRADYCSSTSIDTTSEQVYAFKKGVKAIRWDKSRESTLKMETELMDLKWLSILLGSDFVTGVTNLSKFEKLTVSSGKITIAETPKAGSLAVFELTSDGITHKKEILVGNPGTTQDKYSISGKDITLNATSQPDGTSMVVYYIYDSAATAQLFQCKTNVYPVNYELFMTTVIRDTNGVDQFFQIHVPNCKPKSTVNFTLSTDSPTKLVMEFDMFGDANDNMYEITLI